VFENSGGPVAYDDVGDLGNHCCVVCFTDSLMRRECRGCCCCWAKSRSDKAN
jgi:hypothetical protein